MDLLVLSIMIKNEESSLIKTLKSFVDAGIFNIFIYDTGSTDKSVEIVKKYFDENGLNGIVVEEPFENFSISRNRCINQVKKRFIDTKVIFNLMIDSEWYGNNVDDLLNFCNEVKDEKLYRGFQMSQF